MRVPSDDSFRSAERSKEGMIITQKAQRISLTNLRISDPT
jgi:hypothetical protein